MASPSQSSDVAHLVFHVRRARSKAIGLARTEALTLLGDLRATAPLGGPLSDRGGVFWVDLPDRDLPSLEDRLPRLGYTVAVDLLVCLPAGRRTYQHAIRWRGQYHQLTRVYEEDDHHYRASSPDRRPFVLPEVGGGTRVVDGYRGDGGPLSRRALPVCDARLLVNLVGPPKHGASFLDPFAGAGGVVREAIESGYHVFSIDLDTKVRYGLSALTHRHVVGDTQHPPVRDMTFTALATELPFATELQKDLGRILVSLHAVLASGARLSTMCAPWQRKPLQEAGNRLGLEALIDAAVARKSTTCHVLVWRRSD